MGKKLAVIFTDHYPYGVGDEFLEHEVAHLSESFDQLLFIPMLAKSDAQITRTLPANASATLPPKTLSDDWRVHAIKWFFPIIFFHRDMVETWPWKSFIRWILDMRLATGILQMRSRLRKVFREQVATADQVALYSYWFYTGAGVGALWKRSLSRNGKQVKLVSRAHAYDVDEPDTAHGYLPGRPFLLNAVDEVYPISEYSAKLLRQRCPEHAHKVIIRRLGVPPSANTSREKKTPLWIVSCSHMAPYKRVDLLLAAIAELAQRGVDIKWTHIGEFMPERLAAMKTKAAELLPAGIYDFVGPQVNTEVRRLYAEEGFAVFVNSSFSEGVPVAIMEAQAAGMPVVATDAGGTREIVKEDNGIVVPVESSPAQLADAIEQVANASEEQYQAWSAGAVAGWEARSNGPRQYADIARRLGEIVNE